MGQCYQIIRQITTEYHVLGLSPWDTGSGGLTIQPSSDLELRIATSSMYRMWNFSLRQRQHLLIIGSNVAKLLLRNFQYIWGSCPAFFLETNMYFDISARLRDQYMFGYFSPPQRPMWLISTRTGTPLEICRWLPQIVFTLLTCVRQVNVHFQAVFRRASSSIDPVRKKKSFK